jgi:putative ABC transport system substrate-binding protein
MRRRDFITAIAGSVTPWLLAAQAQHLAMPVIGVLGTQFPENVSPTAVRRGLNQTGFVEGKNIAIELRWAEGRYERLPSLVADLIERQAAVIVAIGGPAARAAKAATKTIPIVFFVGVDPVTEGLVASINRPGGNATGASVIGRELNAKKLELMCELVSTATVIGLLVNPSNPYHDIYTRDIKAAANGLGRQILELNVGTERDLDMIFAQLRQHHADGLIITDEPLFGMLREQLVALAARHKIPTIYSWRDHTQAGGLISYGPNRADILRQVGIYAGRILKGDKPSDLPILLPTKFEIVINLKTASALGLDVPTAVLLRADEVIE